MVRGLGLVEVFCGQRGYGSVLIRGYSKGIVYAYLQLASERKGAENAFPMATYRELAELFI